MTSMSRLMTGGHGLRRPRAIGFLVAAALVVGLTYLARPTASVAPPVAPAGAAVAAPGSIEQIDRSIKVWASNLSAEPRDFISATTLANLYHARGRLTGDLADHQKALEAARIAIKIAPTEPGGRDLEAAILYTLHDFSGALKAATSLYHDDPTQLGALATMADSTLELGNIADARADYAKLAAKANGAEVDVRLARLAFVTGGMSQSLALARSASADAAAKARNGETPDLGFYDYAVGEYARLTGDETSARAGYVAALGVRAGDIGALVGLARIDAYDGHTAAAIAGLEKAAAIAPQPETLGLLSDLLAASGDVAGANKQFATVRFIEQLGEIQSTVFDRVLLRFDLDHGGASEAVLAKARTSLAGRPDTSGHDTLAWALYRLGRFDDASTEMKAAAADGAADARLTFHAGAIALADGDMVGGRTALQKALALGPALDPIERAEAQRLLGQ
jgi:tetratricopeptide (TPR) repeat protein